MAHRLRDDGIGPLPISHAHALRGADLPAHHRDPSDRLLVARALLDQLVIVTDDPLIRRYEVEVLAA